MIAELISSISVDRRHPRLLIQQLTSFADRLKDDDARTAALAELVQKVEIAGDRIGIELSTAAALGDMTPTEESVAMPASFRRVLSDRLARRSTAEPKTAGRGGRDTSSVGLIRRH